jgi:hypothetical protein
MGVSIKYYTLIYVICIGKHMAGEAGTEEEERE